MKKLITLSVIAILFAFSSAFALPNFWYSGVAYNSSGQIITTSPLASVEITVTDGTNIMTQTIPNVPVNAFGIFNVFVNGPGLASVTMKPNSTIMIKVNGVTCVGAALSTINLASYNYGDYVELNSSEVTGVLPVANGGTNATTANNALNNLLPSQASNNGKFLQTNGTNASWASLGNSPITASVFTTISSLTPITVGGLSVRCNNGIIQLMRADASGPSSISYMVTTKFFCCAAYNGQPSGESIGTSKFGGEPGRGLPLSTWVNLVDDANPPALTGAYRIIEADIFEDFASKSYKFLGYIDGWGQIHLRLVYYPA